MGNIYPDNNKLPDAPNALQATRVPSSVELPVATSDDPYNLKPTGYTFIFTQKDGSFAHITLPVSPEEIIQTESSTSNVILTAGDVFTDSFGSGLTKISIAGTFGQRLPDNPLSKSGQIAMLKLKDLFKRYLDQLNPVITSDFSSNNRVRMEFYNLKDKEFWIIEPVGDWWTTRRSKGAPFLYRYQLSFVCVSPTSASMYKARDPLQEAKPRFLQVAFKDHQAVMKAWSDSLKDVSKQLGDVASSEAYVENQITTPFSLLSNAVADYLASGAQIINFPIGTIRDIQLSVRTVQEAISTFNINPITNLSLYDSTLDYLLTETNRICCTYLTSSNLFVKTYLSTDFINQQTINIYEITNVNITDILSVNYYTICDGDTLEAIALTLLGDSRFWKMLAQFNNLEYPFITHSGSGLEKTLSVGDKLAVPDTNSGGFTGNFILNAFSNVVPMEVKTFGADFKLDANGDISIIDSTDPTILGHDYAIIMGVPNFKQAIRIKLNVHRGELLVHPNFGMTDLAGYRTLPFLSSKALSEFKGTLLSDSRVADLTNTKVTISGDILVYGVEINTKFVNTPIIMNGSINLL